MDIQKEREAFEKWANENIAKGRMMNWQEWCWKAWQAAKAQAAPEGFVLVPREMYWQKADEIASDHWNKYKYSHVIQQQGQNATGTSIELARLEWCRNKAHQIMRDYKAMIEAQEPK